MTQVFEALKLIFQNHIKFFGLHFAWCFFNIYFTIFHHLSQTRGSTSVILVYISNPHL